MQTKILSHDQKNTLVWWNLFWQFKILPFPTKWTRDESNLALSVNGEHLACLFVSVTGKFCKTLCQFFASLPRPANAHTHLVASFCLIAKATRKLARRSLCIAAGPAGDHMKENWKLTNACKLSWMGPGVLRPQVCDCFWLALASVCVCALIIRLLVGGAWKRRE